MTHTQICPSPLGEILLAADDIGLTGLWFSGQRHFARGLGEHTEAANPALEAALRWLEVYFSGRVPDFTPPLHLTGTAFQLEVWGLLREIPYGKTVTYGELAGRLAKQPMSAQAVGGAVGRNPVSLIVPCHRVVGAGGSLTGYAGGVERKKWLLGLESKS